MRTYKSAKQRYLVFCQSNHIPPLPLSGYSTCLFAVHLAQQGLSPQSISAYMSAVRHLQIAAGFAAIHRCEWPRLQYVIKGIRRSGDCTSKRVRLPITAEILHSLYTVWSEGPLKNTYEACLLWAACCTGFFGFMRSGEFTATNPNSPSIMASDIAVDSHISPSVMRVFLRRAKTDPFGKGVSIYLGKTGSIVCPVAALLNYLASRPSHDGPLFIMQDTTPLTKDMFIRKVREALRQANIDPSAYSGHSFRIGAATAAANAGIPAHIIKMLGRWQSEAYQLYIQTPRETLSSFSHRLVSK